MGHKLKKSISIILTVMMCLTLIPLNVFAVFGTGVDGALSGTAGLEMTQIDPSSLSVKKLGEVEEETPDLSGLSARYNPNDILRVSIFLKDPSALEAGYEAKGIASNKKAASYRDKLKAEQRKITAKIEKTTGRSLDIKWNFTLLVNAISANVRYGDIFKISAVPGVKSVQIENCYELQTAEVNTANSSAYMVGATSAWAGGYTGYGSRIAIIDSGLDVTHQSFDELAFLYSIEQNYDENLLMGEDDIPYDYLVGNGKYVSYKIPFAYNYADQTDEYVDHLHDTQTDHGSHVAGIAAANRYIRNGLEYVDAADTVYAVGMAPDAQIMAMKVFGAHGAYDSDYFAALQDAIVLGCDAANLSLGSAYPGFTYSENEYQTIMNSLANGEADFGMVVSISAGNNASVAYNLGMDMFIEDVYTQTSGDPGTYINGLCVASADNVGVTGSLLKFNDSVLVTYNDDSTPPLSDLEGSFDYVYIDSIGTPEEYSAVDAEVGLSGKVIIVNRGELYFSEKANNAIQYSPKAVLIANNQPGTIGMDLSAFTGNFPVTLITLADALRIIDSSAHGETADGVAYHTGSINISKEIQSGLTTTREDAIMSDFSSWGVAGSLLLKPEITAPGGNIYSVYGSNLTESGNIAGGSDKYVSYSGTSMASPHISGMAAVLAQYLKENNISIDGYTRRAVMQSLLMSTATPMKTEGEYYPVLQQGAGLADVFRAVTSSSVLMMDDAYLTTSTGAAADGKVKVELGDDPAKAGVYTYSFTLYNTSNEKLKFDVKTDLFTQDQYDYYGYTFMSESTTGLESEQTVVWEPVDADFSYDVDGDGITTSADAQAILDYLTGVNNGAGLDLAVADADGDAKVTSRDAYMILDSIYAVSDGVIPAHGSRKATVTVRLTDDQKAALDAAYPNGAYIEGFTYVTCDTSDDEGVSYVHEHSIPLLGFYGSWTEPSMFDNTSNVDLYYDTYKYPYSEVSETNYMTVNYNGSNNVFLGNPYMVEDVFPADRLAINSGSVIKSIYYNLLRSAGTTGFAVSELDENGDVSEVKSAVVADHYADGLWYYPEANTWFNTAAKGYPVNKSASDFGAAEGDRIRVGFYAIPEYNAMITKNDKTAYNSGILNDAEFGSVIASNVLGKGAFIGYDFIVDDTAPVITSAELNGNDLTVVASDNNAIAYVAIMSLDGEEVYEETAPGTGTYNGTFNIYDVIATAAGSVAVFVADYAGNEATVAVEVNGNGDQDPDVVATVGVSPRNLDLYKGNEVDLNVTVLPVTALDRSVTWSSSDETVATVDQNGHVVAVGGGTATITATSVSDNTKAGTATVSVLSLNKNLNAVIWDEDSDSYFTTFNTDALKDWTANHQTPNALDITSAYVNNDGTVYAAAYDSENKSSTFCTVNPSTYEIVQLGESYIPIIDMAASFDLSMFVAMGYLPAEYAYLMAFINESGVYLAMPVVEDGGEIYYAVPMSSNDFEELIDGAKFAGIALAKQGTGMSDCEYYLLDTNGVIYKTTLSMETEHFSDPVEVIRTGISTDYLNQNLYYDGTYLYWAHCDGEKAELYIIDPVSKNVYNAGDFGEDVWPVMAMFVAGHVAPFSVGVQPQADVDPEKVIEKIRAFRSDAVVSASETANPVVGSLNSVRSSVKVNRLPGSYVLNSARPGSEETDGEDTFVSVVLTSDGAAHNGLVTVEYDATKLEYVDTSCDLENYSVEVADGVITFAYATVDGVVTDDTIATVKFKLKTDGAVSVTVTEKEANDVLDFGEETVVALKSYVAKIGDSSFMSLADAFAAAVDGDTITVLEDCSGSGIIVPQGKFGTEGLTVDFDGHTYTVDSDPLAGSTGTKTQCFQLLKGNKITFTNGAIVADSENIKVIIQNYSDLTLDHMILDATQGTNSVGYVLSTNNDKTAIIDTAITAKEGGIAFDACTGWGGYTSNEVTVSGSSVINGDVEVSFYGTGTAPSLALNGGTMTGEIVMADGANEATVTRDASFEVGAPVDYKWVENDEGGFTLTPVAPILYFNSWKVPDVFYFEDEDPIPPRTTQGTVPTYKRQGASSYVAVTEGDGITVTWTVTTSDATTADGTPSDIATVDENGLVTFTQPGTVKVWVTMSEENVTATKSAYKTVSYKSASVWVEKADGEKVAYASVYSAFNAAQDGEKVVLGADAAITNLGRMELNADKEITLDLNGYTLSLNQNYRETMPGEIISIKKGTLNVISSQPGGAVAASGNNCRAFNLDGTANESSDDAVLNIGAGIDVSSAEDCCVTVFGKATLITAGNLTSPNDFAIAGNGSAGNEGTVIRINSGNITGKEVAIYHPQNGRLFIIDGNISAKTAIYIKSGALFISGGTISADGEAAEFTHNGNGCYATGDAIVIESCNYPGGVPSMVIAGDPTITSENGLQIGDYKYGDAGDAYVASTTSDLTIPENMFWLYSDDVYILTEKVKVAKIGERYFTSIADAFEAAVDGDTITVLEDCSGSGIIVPQGKFGTEGLTVDFDGHTYTVDSDPLAGSTGTKTQCFQLLKGNKITFTNGAIVADNENIKVIIQNYADLTLDNMTLDATQGTNNVGYVLSTNNDKTAIVDTTITAKDGGVAFDACTGWGGYTSNEVTVSGNSVINGDVEVSFYGTGTAPELAFNGGTMTGNIIMAEGANKATVTRDASFDVGAPVNYEWVENDDGGFTLSLSPIQYFNTWSVPNIFYFEYEDPIPERTTQGTVPKYKRQTGSSYIAVTEGDGITVTWTVTTSDATTADGTPSDIATVDENGLVTFTQPGTVKVWVTMSEDNGNPAKSGYKTVSYKSAPAWVEKANGEKVAYASVYSAFNAVQDGEKVVLGADSSTNNLGKMELKDGREITVDLNGHTAAINANYREEAFGALFTVEKGMLNIISSQPGGAIAASGNNCRAFNLDGTANESADEAVLNIGEGVNVSSAEDCCVTVFGKATLITAGNLTSPNDFAIAGNGKAENAGTVIEINGGDITGKEVAIYHPQDGTMTINDGNISANTAIYIKSGDLFINGGTISGNGEAAEFTHNGNGCYATGDAIVIESCNYPGGDPTLTISGNPTITSANGLQIGAYTYGEAENALVTSTTSELTVPEHLFWSAQGDVYVLRERVQFTVADFEDTEYNGEEQKLPVIATGSEDEELVEGTDFEVEYSGDLVNIGTVTVTVTGIGTYEGTTVEKTYNITAKAVTVKADDASKTYGEEDPDEFTATVTGVVDDYEIAYTVSRAGGDNKGTYAITPEGAAEQGNYIVSYENGTFTINAKDVTVKANDASKTYGEADPDEFTATVTGVIDDYEIAYTVSRAGGDNKGTYAITPEGAAEQGNYNVSYEAGTFTINAKAVTVKADDASKTYGEADPDEFTATVTGVIDDYQIVYTVSRAGGDNKGTYAITPEGAAEQGNYIVSYENGTFTINAKDVTVKANDASKTYGEADPDEFTATVTGVIDDYEIAYTVSRAGGDNKGTYAITPEGAAEQGNYNVTYEAGTFTINAKDVTVKANDASKTYGQADPDEFTATVTGVIDDFEIVYTVSRAGGDNKGTYAITPEGAAEQGNYNVSYEAGTFTINAKAITVTANPASKTYGQPDPALTAAVEGLEGDDTISYTVKRAAGEAKGEYAITASGAANQGNYTVSYVPATFTINAKPVTVKANNAAKVKDSNDPQLTAKATGLVGSDTLAYTVSRATGDEIGTYAITVSGAAEQGSYIVTYEDGLFTIFDCEVEVNEETGKIEITVLPQDSSDIEIGDVSATYRSNNTAVVKVDSDGKITEVGGGSTTVDVTVTATVNGVETTFVKSLPISVDSFNFSSSASSFEVGDTGTFEITGNTDQEYTVEFTSSDDNVITVDSETGAYEVVGKGTATVTAKVTLENGKTFTVTKNVSCSAGSSSSSGKIRCWLCPTYEKLRDVPVVGIVITVLHFIVHLLTAMGFRI